MKILYSSKFAKEYKKLPLEIKLIAEEKEKLFRQDPFNPKLKTHKLKGKLKDYYSFSISYSLRLVFYFEGEDIVFDAIGNYAIYK